MPDPVLQHGAEPARMPAAVPAVPGEEGAALGWEQPLDLAVEGISGIALQQSPGTAALLVLTPPAPGVHPQPSGMGRIGVRAALASGLSSRWVDGKGSHTGDPAADLFSLHAVHGPAGLLPGTGGCGGSADLIRAACAGRARQRRVKGQSTFIRALSPDRFVLFQLPKAKLTFQVLPAQSRSERGAAAHCRPCLCRAEGERAWHSWGELPSLLPSSSLGVFSGWAFFY